MNTYLLGIDIGTSACKIAIFDSRTGVAISQDNQSYPVYYPQKNWAEQDPEEWWRAVCTGIKNCLDKSGISPKEIQAIGVDGQSWSTIPIDKNHHVLARTPIWFDTRSEKQCLALKKSIGDDLVFKLNGNVFRPTHMTPKYLWFKEECPSIYHRTYQFLTSNGYLVLKLTGKVSSDHSQNYGVHFFDTINMRYDEDLARDMGLDSQKLPPSYACHEIVGKVTAEAAVQTGLISGIPVVAGGLDAATGTLGCGILEDSEAQIQGGQAGGMSICESNPLSDERLIFGPHVVPDRWLLQGGTVGGGGVLRWIRESFLDSLSFDEITELAKDAPPASEGVFFFPYLAGERSPIWNSEAKGVFYGLSFDKGRPHMLRSALEGVVYSVAHNFYIAFDCGIDPRGLKVRAMGGVANSTFWIQIFSDVLNQKIEVASSDTATNLGSVILAGVGVGLYEDFSIAKKFARITREQTPIIENVSIYQNGFQNYLRISEGLNRIFESDRKF